MAVSLERAEFETQIFWDQVDPVEHEETFDCPVCGTVNDWQGCCSSECHRAWTSDYDVDPMEYDRW